MFKNFFRLPDPGMFKNIKLKRISIRSTDSKHDVKTILENENPDKVINIVEKIINFNKRRSKKRLYNTKIRLDTNILNTKYLKQYKLL